MSFILDALKKSENDRQRQSGPGLFEVKVAAPKARFPMWAVALAALLAVNIGVVSWLVLRQPSRASVANAAPAPVMASSAQPAAAAASPVAPAALAPPPAATAPPPPLESPAAPLVDSSATDSAPVGTAAAQPSAEPINPDDYEPATELPPPSSEGHTTTGTTEGLPTYEQVAGTAGSGVPDLRLDLHVYAAKPQDRFILLNMHRLREGDSLAEGVRVEKITSDGAVLSFRGSKFVLERD